MYCFNHAAMMDLPDWANLLKNHYQRLRLQKRNATKRRYWYRAIRKERLRLVEAGVDEELINAVCKYLASLKDVNAARLKVVIEGKFKQFSFDFDDPSI